MIKQFDIYLLLVLILIGCTQEKLEAVENVKDVNDTFLIEAEQLLKAAERPHIKLLDFRRDVDYNQGHIPGAVQIWRSDIEDSSYAYGGIMASKEQIELLLGSKGIGSQDTLIVYDDNGLCNASRLWWILQNYDFDRIKLFHGGLDAWNEAGGELTVEIPVKSKAEFILSDSPSMKYAVSKEELQEAIALNTVLLDTRTTDEYSGKRQKKGAYRAGRIPGSIHIDWADATDYHGDMRMRTLIELGGIYAKLDVSKESPIIVYCHSGVRSAHTNFVLTQLLGYTNVKNYDGSWIEWSYYEELPVEYDSLTLIEQ